jgi:hypothetical protein
MWATIKILRLFIRNLNRIATSLEKLDALYEADLASRGIVLTRPNFSDQAEMSYTTDVFPDE